MNNKKWGIIKLDDNVATSDYVAYKTQWTDSLQQAYTLVARKMEKGEINWAIIKLNQITDFELKEKSTKN